MPKAKPNIVFILLDDLGWADSTPYGSRLAETPNLARLASQGMKFTQAYAPAPICSAARAALLTGRSPARLHYEFVPQPPAKKESADTLLEQPSFPSSLPLAEITLAETLSRAGYVAGYFGKWHLAQDRIPSNPRYLGHGKESGPDKQGFAITSEERGSHPYNYPKGVKNAPASIFTKVGEFAPDKLIDEALDFLRTQKDKRFFLYLSNYYVHDPVHARCPWLLEKYKEKAERLGIDVTEDQMRFAAFVETADHLVGRVLDELDRLKLSDNTLVIFTSDNGGHPRFSFNGLRGSKWTLYEGGIREPMIVRWPGVVAPKSICDVPVVGMDFMPTFCEVAGAKPPAVLLDGVSFLPLLTGKSQKLERDTITWHFPFYHKAWVDTRPCSAMRKGDLKIIYFYEDERVELFDLVTDPQEAHDLAREHPELASKLRDELLARLAAEDARFAKQRNNQER